MTSDKIMKFYDQYGSVMYRAACSCGHPNHDVTLCASYDKDCNHVELEFYANAVSSGLVYYDSDDIWLKYVWKVVKFRTKAIFDIIFKGYHETEIIFTMRDESQINAFLAAIEEGRTKMQKEKRVE